ncbi:MAG TPA: (2Fe-2S)-binding protein [bacterium]|nr:(2Fe-2S)-binding protein [bacterium]
MTPSNETAAPLRLEGDVRRGRKITITVNDRPVTAYLGESVAAALIAEGCRAFRRTARTGEPRGLFCGMGVCYDCLVVIDGLPGRRACMTDVRDGMRVALQEGWGEPELGPSSNR